MGWGPDLDDGVKVNIEPLQKAGVLRVAMRMRSLENSSMSIARSPDKRFRALGHSPWPPVDGS
jgi:hypothetical protein